MRHEDEIEDRLEDQRELKEQYEEEDRSTRYWDGWIAALEWVLSDNPLEEELGQRFETCPVKGVDCDEGPFYGMMLLAHMKEEHPEAHDAVTVDEEAA